jgi:Relaxase/Mobilisation nuclease domain.
VQLAEKLYPEYQSAVYTHLDGENHHLHNHIIVNKVSLATGKKLDEKRGQTVRRVRAANDDLARAQGWHILPPVREHQSPTEQDLDCKPTSILTWLISATALIQLCKTPL